MKKLLSVLICATLIVCILSVNAFAIVFDFDTDNGDSPVIDGVINEGEYAWSTFELDKLVEYSGEFYVTVEHTDTPAMTVEYLLDYDDDYIYFAFKERTTGYTSDVLYDFVFCTADAKAKDTMSLEVRFVRNNDMTEAYAPDFSLFLINNAEASEELDTYVVESNGTYWDDGTRNNNYVEMKLDRAAIESLVGSELSGMGFRMVACTGEDKTGETVYGDEESVVYPSENNTHIGYHFIEFEIGALDDLAAYEDVDTTPETTPAEEVPGESTPVESAADTEPVESEPKAEGGCGASVAAVTVAVVAMLGTCVAFITKK